MDLQLKGKRALVTDGSRGIGKVIARVLADHAITALGGIDILVNGAAVPGGASPASRLAELMDAQILEDFNVKVVGCLRTARALAPHFARNGWGRIINIGGLAALRTGRTDAAAEARAKSNGIGRIVDAREVAQVNAFLASPLSVAINGETIDVGGGSVGVIRY